MRKLLTVVFLASAQMASPAEYLTKPHQTIDDVHRQVGHTPWQLRQMNNLRAYTSEEELPEGVVITYVSSGDFRDACDRVQELGNAKVLELFKQGFSHMQYQTGTDGIRYDVVLALARQYRELHTDIQILTMRDKILRGENSLGALTVCESL